MTINKINSTPSFKGYLRIPVSEMIDGKIKRESFAVRNINAKNIISIEDTNEGLGFGSGCIISTKYNKFIYIYPFTISYEDENENLTKFTDINTVLNAYKNAMAADANSIIEI